MRTQILFKVAVLTGLLTLSSCTSKATEPGKHSGLLKDHFDLEETKLALGQTILHWVDPSYSESKYGNIAYSPVMYYSVPKPTTQVRQQVLDQLLTYTNTKLKTTTGQCKPLATTPGPCNLISRRATTGVATSREGLQFHEVIPVTLLVARTQMATGHRTMDTNLYSEGELIDVVTSKPMIRVVCKGEGKDLNNENTPTAFETLKRAVDDMATDASMFDVNKEPQ